ncbi:MAG: ABC transporter substrate-binding protein [Clostridiales bacterium]|nr:ABC transporter substrate-binding protein [Clostridiales bacterium]
MKKGLAFFLALLMLLSTCCAMAEAPVAAPNYDELVVGSTTAMTGHFFTDMWGRNTADMDVRTLIHAYNPIRWNGDAGAFGIDDTVVSGMVVTEDEEGNRTYTLALYNDLVYSDGTPITAKDYAFSLLFSIAPQVAEIGGAISSPDYIYGIEAYMNGQSDVLAGVRLPGGNQLAITVKAAYLPFFYELALLSVTPYPIHVIAPGCEVADDGQGVYIRNIDRNNPNPVFTAELLRKTVLDAQTGYLTHPAVTSGPYRLVSYDAQANVAEFEINTYYKGNMEGKLPLIPRIVYKPASNEDMISRLAMGEYGLLNKCVNASTLDAGLQLVADGLASVSNYARSGYSFISFNCERPAMQSAKVRQAIANCFDKDSFIADYVRNYGLRVDGYYGIGQWMYRLVEGDVEPPVEAPAENADRATIAAYEETLKKWEELSLENMRVYNLDLAAAEKLLLDDGWTLNRARRPYDARLNVERCKEVDGKLLALELKLIYPEGNAVGEALGTALKQNLAEVGISLTVEAKPFAELLRIYYRQDARDCDMIYLATNFTTVFEPSAVFNPDNAQQGINNCTGIIAPELYELAVAMRQVEPGDVLGYCQQWVAFQEAWAEELPTIPVYSNVYFDFYTPYLHEYNAAASTSWAEAIIGAYLGDVEAPEAPVEGEEDVFFD